MSEVMIDKLPTSIDGFVALRDRLAETPQGGAAIFAAALLIYAQDQALGRQCLALAVARKRLREGAQGYKGWELIPQELRRLDERVRARPYVARSYVRGTSPDDGYRLPAGPLRFEVTDNPHSGDVSTGIFKVFVASSGADSPRPITLERNNRGVWKATEWSSLTSGVRAPASAVDDEL